MYAATFVCFWADISGNIGPESSISGSKTQVQGPAIPECRSLVLEVNRNTGSSMHHTERFYNIETHGMNESVDTTIDNILQDQYSTTLSDKLVIVAALKDDVFNRLLYKVHLSIIQHMFNGPYDNLL